MAGLIRRVIVLCIASMVALPFFSTNGYAAERQLVVYNTYSDEPFVTPTGGLAAELVAYLNGRLAGKYHFTLQTMPRMRLNQLVISAPDFDGIVLFLNPNFVVDTTHKFYWTDPFMQDANYVVSNVDRKIDYTGPASLNGLKFGAIRGYHYLNLDSQFGETIEREDANDEVANLKKVAFGRVDVTIVPASNYRYFVKSADSSFTAKLYVARQRHMTFSRYIFCASNDVALSRDLAAVVASMKSDKRWADVMNSFGLSDLNL